MPTTMSSSPPSSAPARNIATATNVQQHKEDFTKIRVPNDGLNTDLDPPKAAKLPTAVANYQTRWEREKAKAHAEGVEIEPKDPKMIGPWILGEMLGRGASGRVRLARHYKTEKMAAVKILNLHPHLSSRSSLANANEKAEKMMLTAEREIAVMKLLDHPNIMKMYDVWSSPNELYLVLEYVRGGELFDYLCSRGSRLPLLEAVSIIKQVLAGVDYCHRFNICHRDLKPENILLTSDSGSTDSAIDVKQVKIADFGMSTLDSLNGLLRTSCGSPHYASPEIVRGQTYSGASSDIWSCGVILFALLTSRLPFDDPNVNNVLRKVRDGRFTIPDWVVPEAKDLLTRMLEVDLNKRIPMSDILSHPLLQMDTPGIVLPPVPKIEEIALPVAQDDIDSDLLRNLCIIWREKDRTSMVDRLCSTDKNFEKAFYFLLCRYRDRSFEEYNMDPLSSQSGPPTPLPTPPYNVTSFDRSGSPVKRHYPGRVGSQASVGKRVISTTQSGSPRSSKIRRNSVRGDSGGSDKRSPKRIRVLADPSVSHNRPVRRDSVKSGTGNQKRGANEHPNPGKISGTSQKPSTPTKKGTKTSFVSPRKSSDSPASKRSIITQAHRRASSTGASVGPPAPRIGSPTFLPNPVGGVGEPKTALDTVLEDTVVQATQPVSSLTQLPNIPLGIVQRRASLLTAKISSVSQAGAKSPSTPCPNPSPRISSQNYATPRQLSPGPTTPRAVRVRSPGIDPLTRPFSRVVGSPAVYVPVSPARTRSTVPGSPVPEQVVGIPDIEDESQASNISSTKPLPVLPANASAKARYGLGLGVHVASSQHPLSPTRDTSMRARPSLPNDELVPSDMILPHVRAGAEWRMSDFGDLLGELGGVDKVAGEVSNIPTTKEEIVSDDRKSISSQPENKPSSDARSKSLDLPGESERELSKKNTPPRGGQISGESTGSSQWEKLDWTTESSSSGGNELGNGMAAKRFKKKPPPLDLRNPYQKERRNQPAPPLLSTPDAHRKTQSPLLSPFLGFAGRHWAAGSPTPPTPSLLTSAMTGVTNSSTGIGASRGLFSRMWDWKSPNLYLVSMETTVATKEECTRLLRSLNIAFSVSENGGFRCRAEEITDLQGNKASKTVRFRLDIGLASANDLATPPLVDSASSASSADRYSTSGSRSQWNNALDSTVYPKNACLVTFVQERGAYSMLKAIHQRIQHSWMLGKAQEVEYSPLPGGHPLTPVSARMAIGGHRSSPMLS